jgi:hypothetical protein
VRYGQFLLRHPKVLRCTGTRVCSMMIQQNIAAVEADWKANGVPKIFR